MNLYFLKNFNNYFNRIVKHLSSLDDYLLVVGDDGYFLLENTNFVPHDGVSTIHVAGSSSSPFDKDWQPDYCLVVDDQDNIVSRWYVIHFDRLMSGQYRAELKRDTPCDKYIPLLDAECYMEKAHVSNSDPFIVNNEGIQFNQIKTKEYFLKDKSKVPWLIVYLKQKREGTEHETSEETSPLGYEIKAKFEDTGGDAIPLEDDPAASQVFLPGGQFRKSAELKNFTYGGNRLRASFEIAGQGIWVGFPWGWENPHNFWWDINESQAKTKVQTGVPHFDEWHTGIAVPTRVEVENAALDTIRQLHNDDVTRMFNNKIDHTGDNYNTYDRNIPVPSHKKYSYNGKIYQVRKAMLREENYTPSDLNDIAEVYRDKWNDLKPKPTGGAWHGGTNSGFTMSCQVETWSYILDEIPIGDARGFIRNGVSNDEAKEDNLEVRHLIDVPYDILAFPLNDIDVYNGDTKLFTSNPNIPLNFARQIIKKLGDFAIDVQVLPFAPCYDMTIISNDGKIQIEEYDDQRDYIIIKDTLTNTPMAIGFYALRSVNTFDISTLADGIWDKGNNRPVSTIMETNDKKIDSNCDMWRLCSPNFASQFEFGLSKCIPTDRPYLSKFNVDITYRPHNPYIKINPDFAFLYGQDFNDARGLICSGDFGITTLSSAWTTYVNNNKNYQNIFDRQIYNMETNRQISREQEEWNITKSWVGLGTGIAGAAAAGGLAGAFMKKPGRAVGGAITGGLLGAVGSGMGIAGSYKQAEWNERAYQEQRSFSIDMFNMQMDNIRAMPDSITHTSSLSYNFKFFPVLEYYTCTETEKDALRDKIRFNGMTVGRIGRISEYISSNEERFIKGQIIRIYYLGEDSHLAQDLYEEVNKGLFFLPVQEMLDEHKKERR